MKLFETTSALQRITLTTDEDTGLTLLLDDFPQFVELTEYRYHECLAIAPLAFVQARRVFIAGGGDGLAAARLLRVPQIEQIVLCDYDPEMTRLASEHPELRRLNEGSLEDPRVTVHNTDAVAWLADHDERFDLIICDFPDPYFPPLGRLYTSELYRLIASRLSPDGVMITQTLAVAAVTRTIRATVRSAFEHEGHYRICPGVGFTLGSKRPLTPRFGMPPWTLFLSDAVIGALFVLTKDVEAELDPSETAPNTGDGEALVADALVNAMGEAMTAHAYRLDMGELLLTPETVGRLTPEQGELLLRNMPRRERVLMLVSSQLEPRFGAAIRALGYARSPKSYEYYHAYLTPELLERLGTYWARLDDGSVAHLDARTCQPGERPDVQGLLTRYLESHAARFFDAPQSRIDPDAYGRYVVTSDPAGQPVALFKLLEKEDTLTPTTELEIIYGEGSSRQTLLSLILALNYLARLGVAAVEAYVPAGVFGRSLGRLGARHADTIAVYVPSESPP